MDGAVIGALLEESADVNARDLGGFTALMTLGSVARFLSSVFLDAMGIIFESFLDHF